MADEPGFSVNRQTVGLAVGVISVLGATIGGYNWLLSGRAENSPIVREMTIKSAAQSERLGKAEEYIQNNTAVLKEQTAEIQNLKEAVVRLTTTIETDVLKKQARLSGFDVLEKKVD